MFKRLVASSLCVGAMQVPGLENEARFNQLVDTMTLANSNFSPNKFWAYGCNCQMINAISDPTRGPPKDELDTTCKKFKDCLKCVAMDYGETCVNEYYSYKIRDQKAGLTCKNDAGSCARALCECDKQFAEAHAAVADQYDSQFHIFNGGFVPEESCPPDQKGNGNGTPKCCGSDDGPKLLYNGNGNKKCCADGSVKVDCDGMETGY